MKAIENPRNLEEIVRGDVAEREIRAHIRDLRRAVPKLPELAPMGRMEP
jgi:hypothetical protein